MKPRFPGKKTCHVSCQTCVLYTFVFFVFLVVISNVISYTTLTNKAGFFHQYIRNISFMESSYVVNSTSRKTFGWMSPAIINKHTRFPNVSNNVTTGTTTHSNTRTNSINRISFPPKVVSKNKTDDFRKTHFMTVHGNGRLGNQMFQFAALLGASAFHKYSPFVAPKNKLMQVFDIAEARVINMINVQGHGEDRAGVFDKRIQTLSHSKNWTLQGYFQSWRYFDHVANDVRNAFRFKHDIYHKAFTKLKTLTASVMVGVHVRRGDMNSKRELSRGYNVADETFVIKALNYFRSKYKNPVFVMIGDDAAWMRSKFNYGDVHIATSGSAGADLAIMAQCNHSVVTSGTYGWWGAYLAGGETVYFRDYPKPGSWLERQYNRADYYLPNWIGMS
ncbi:galactoside 2-alpha-L-fucosyltransferase 2-like [Pecten maximus]|uniref:galactoside 2-alpha-L-fucosyltransferase 2-like n=1 Tax=Pecten maximus TaxID=6579 RepID=UPI0014585827|nr:galactoside 2-alpha-L-fucosyltransferase 2-like [Pecten maximus]XP_033725794.1 galactoside 2-alpha-L-fucosyltransferase 2-like [Pecten maximus]XP_033725795.1 galactoside 2-alpha-L-fucosyltransferase 2-like [Pecten maximus]XP_033725797.1 galactoside 2-alpha-L-fucosyltransferase 2-like [Pecten maximus]XP_033725798.1 galactoside 2-alpha-L-fucosyltransferase 2-like [Pecten maximus]XP_033725799.1 galactoside 2-alpha-L-fucosyltransferase 2-like [Pecten maximus]XP_033725800.1 galactoside 2-alpha-